MIKIDLQTRFSDFDMLGHLNNVSYAQFMDLGKTDYFARLSGGKIDWQDVTLVLANLNINYLAQTLYGEPLHVLTELDSIGNKSLTLHQQVINSATGQVKADAKAVMVNIDLKAGVTMPITDEWRERIARLEGNNPA